MKSYYINIYINPSNPDQQSIFLLQASEESASIPSAAPGPEFEDSGSSEREAEVDCSLPPD